MKELFARNLTLLKDFLMYFTSKAIEQLISSSRMDAFKFGLLNDPKHYSQQELIGSYIWNQQMAACIYPLLQNLEIFLRNAVDRAVRNKYGNFWWEKIFSNNKDHTFYQGIQLAKRNLKKNWQQRSSKNPPNWTHDQIVAATTLGMWVSVFDHDFFRSSNNQRAYLWPNLLGVVFTQYHLIDNKPKKAVTKVRQILDELTYYRNRIAHHEPTWMKKPNLSHTPSSSLETIVEKINKMELIYRILHKDIEHYMRQNGLIQNALTHCDLRVLEVYQGVKKDIPKLSRKYQRLLELNSLVRNQKYSIYRRYRSHLIILKKF